MSILAAVSGGSVLEPPQPLKLDLDFTPLKDSLYTSLTDAQRQVYDASTRFTYLCSGRRFGKTYLSLTRLIT